MSGGAAPSPPPPPPGGAGGTTQNNPPIKSEEPSYANSIAREVRVEEFKSALLARKERVEELKLLMTLVEGNELDEAKRELKVLLQGKPPSAPTK